MKKLFLYLSLSLVIVCTGCNKYMVNSNSYDWVQNTLIAHAAGGIDNHHYTNSFEAFKESYLEGYRLMEIDVSITSDNRLVVRHEWKDDFGQVLNNNELPVSYNKFMSHKIFGKYTPMSFNDVLQLMKKYPDIYVIIDGKVSSVEDTKKLYKEIGKVTKNINNSVRTRLIPQMFYEEDLDIIRGYGFHDLLYVVGREQYTSESIVKFCLDNDVMAVSLSVSRTNKKFIKTLSDNNIAAYMYTLNDIKQMKEYEEIGINGFFTDFVIPNDLK